MDDKYNTLKNALIIERNDKLLKEFEKLIIEMDREDNDEYLQEYEKYDNMTLTVEKEEEKLNNIIDLINKRVNKQKQYRDDYSYITGEDAYFLIDIMDYEKLPDLEKRLDIVKHYLSIKDRIVNLSLNIKEYNKELKDNPDNRRINTKLNKSSKKINGLLNSLKKEEILELLYEFCIVDSYHVEDVDNNIMLKNILSTNTKKREKKVKIYKKEENVDEIKDISISDKNKVEDKKDIEIKNKKDGNNINISDASIFIIPGDKLEISDSEDVPKKDIEEYVGYNEEKEEDNNNDIVVIEENKDEETENKEEETEEKACEEEKQDDVEPENIEEDYVKQMIPIDMLKIDKIGTVRPVSMMEKLENAQEEEGDLTIPSMGVLDNNNDVTIDSNDFLKNSTKNDKMS